MPTTRSSHEYARSIGRARLFSPRLLCLVVAVGMLTLVPAFGARAAQGAHSSVSIGNATVTEGDEGLTDAVFELKLSKPSAQGVKVRYKAGTGTATSGDDYATARGVVTFKPGRTTKLIVVQVVGDTEEEPEETFWVTLSGPRNARIADGSGRGTITDDDTIVGSTGDGGGGGGSVGASSPSLSISNASVTEGNSGSRSAVFNVSLSEPSTVTVTVNYATANGSATAPADYQSTSGTLTFDPGEVSRQVTVQVAGDTAIEANETFSVNLSNATNATILDGSGLGTITDNDTVTVTINNVTVNEGNAGFTNAVFTVSLSAPSGSTVTVTYQTADGSATAPADYVTASGTLVFNPGQVSRQIVVQVVGDLVPETNETFSVNLTDATNATIGGSGFGLGTINNND